VTQPKIERSTNEMAKENTIALDHVDGHHDDGGHDNGSEDDGGQYMGWVEQTTLQSKGHYLH
jgi:hypothetical protein